MVRNSQYDQWLKTNMQGKYSNVDAAKKDAINAMMHYKDLKPTTDRFMYNDGSSKNLVCLIGTIPVNYKGTTYNIPIGIWLQEAHPHLPPLCFVKPTSTMQVRQGKHVDANGRVYLPYLNEWRAGSHNLIGCIQVMIGVFASEPPVYAKQAAPSRPPPPRPTQPYPPVHQPTPPYPNASFTPQGPPTTNYQPHFGPAPYPTTTNQPTPYPTPPTSSYQPYPGPGYPPVPGPPNAMGMHPTPYPSPQTQIASPQQKQSTIDDDMIKASLLTAVNDKLKRRMKDTFAQADQEMSLLKQTESELKIGQAKLDTIIKRLENEISDADANMIMLEQKNEELEKEVERLQQRQDNLEVDEVVMATTPVYRQIVSSFAEEQGLEDAIYYLGEALHKDVLDTDTFLKHVRSLSRQQFMLRAVIQKARKSAGLANVY